MLQDVGSDLHAIIIPEVRVLPSESSKISVLEL